MQQLGRICIWKGGSSYAKETEQAIRSSRVAEFGKMMLKEAAIWAWNDKPGRIHYELCFKCLRH